MQLYAGGYLTFYMPDKQPEIVCKLTEPTKLYDFLRATGIPVAEVQLVIVNGTIVDLENAILEDQDRVKIFPGVDGG